MKADIAGSILLVVLKYFFLLNLHFAKARDNRASMHPGHLNRRRTSTIIFVSNGSGRKLMKQILRQVQQSKGNKTVM